MKPLLTSLVICFTMLFFSCSKDSDSTPTPPVTPTPETPSDTETSTIPVFDRITFRHLEDDNVVEEIYSFTYDASGRITGTTRVDKNMPSLKFNYAGNNLSSVVVYTTIGTVGATYVADESLFVGQDTISFFHLVDLFPDDALDTVAQAFYFNDSLLKKGTVHYGSAMEEYRISYDNYVCNYGDDKNLAEIGYTNTSQQYVKYMDVTATDDKVNPMRYASRIAYVFAISVIDVELLSGTNNITAVTYGDGTTAAFEYTYNEKGWPLTVKEKGQTFAKYEFQYKP